MDQPLNEQQSLQIIESMINKAKNNFSENGTLYLFWGFMVLVCCLVQFILLEVFHYEKSYLIWQLMWLAGVLQIFLIRRKKKYVIVNTYTGEIMKYVWLVFFGCMVLVIFILSYFKMFQAINPMVLVLYGMPTILAGVILKYRLLVIGGLACWALSIPAMMVPYSYQLLCISAAVIFGWIIPGFALRKKFHQSILKT
ncbi:MAG: hypothetical protein ABIT96_09940 [Ferruginibacter sp.]